MALPGERVRNSPFGILAASASSSSGAAATASVGGGGSGNPSGGHRWMVREDTFT